MMRQFATTFYRIGRQGQGYHQHPLFYFSKKTIELPKMGDSISQGDVKEYQKSNNEEVGDYVQLDEVIALVETDKITIDIRSPEAGLLTKLFATEGQTVEVGKPFFEIDTSAPKPTATSTNVAASAAAPKAAPSTAPPKAAPQQQQQQQQQTPTTAAPPKKQAVVPPPVIGSRNERREPMSRMRQRIAQRLKDAQNTYAMLTTFQEVDMSAVMEAREALQKDFQKKHNVKLGFMSFFVKASVACLQEFPIINAVIDANQIIYRDYIDISVAVATPNGLMVPVLRNCEALSFADIEKNLVELANKGKEGKIGTDDMAGGTFTISNGGVFGSMLGTPIINAPQSAILGMHAIINRPVVRGESIVARPIMYLALTYDHRIMDGREGASFLKKLAVEIEDPRRLLLGI